MLSRRTPEYAVRRMVSAISSAIESSVLRKSSNAMGSRTMEFPLLAACVGGKCMTRGCANPPPIPNLFFIMQLDDDVAVRVQRGVRAGRDHARRIVFLDDAGPFAWRREIRPVDDRRLAPPELGTEIDAPLPAGATGPRAIDVQGFRNPRPIREAEADDAQAHDLDGLV